MSKLAVNGFQLSAGQMTDDWFDSVPTESEMSNWLGNLAVKLKPSPIVNRETAKPAELAKALAGLILRAWLCGYHADRIGHQL